ncbi:MAG: outer membrane protein assembly factor BamB family protein [Planctomycetota bacterium]
MRIVLIAALLLLISSSNLEAQHDRFQGWDRLLNETFVRNPDRKSLRNFRVPESWDAERLFRRARELLENDQTERAIPLLQEMIEEYPDQVFQIAIDSLDGLKGLARFVGASEIGHYVLASLPAEDRVQYDAFVEERARTLLDKAIADMDLEALNRIGEKYAASALGKEAFSFLAMYYLELGASDLASLYFKKMLLFLSDPDLGIVARLVQALDQSGREEEKQFFISRLHETDIARSAHAAFLSDLILNPPIHAARTNDWLTMGGNNARNRPMSLFSRNADFSRQWNQYFPNDRLAELNPFASMSRTTGLVPFQLARAGEILVVNDSLSATAFNIYTGEELWHFKGPLETSDDDENYYSLEDYVSHAGYSRRGLSATTSMSPYLIAGATLAGDVVLLNLQDRRERKLTRRLDRRVINKAIPRRALFALRLSDGQELWSHGVSEPARDDFLSRISIASPPVVLGDRVLCSGFLREGGINTFVMSFDLEKGGMQWKVPVGIGQQELTMFNMEYKEFTSTPISESEGTIVLSSNLGFVCAVDALSGSIVWLTEYETMELPQATHFSSSPNPRRVYWSNNPPVTASDVVVVTPLDCQYILAFDWRTGEPRWKVHPHRLGSDLYPHMLGVHDDKVILSGKAGALALSLDDGSLRWRVTLPPNSTVTGRGGLDEDRLYLPLDGDLFVYDLEHGKATGTLGISYAEMPANLYLLGEVVAALGPEEIQLFFDAPGMLEHALAKLERGEGRAGDLAFLGDMYRLNDDLDQAVTYYDKALRAAKEDSGFQEAEIARVRGCLFNAYLEYGEVLRVEGRDEEALSYLRRAFDDAWEPDRIVAAALPLLDFFRQGDRLEEIELVLERLLRECADHRFDFFGLEGIDTAPVGYYGHRLRYSLAEEAGNTPEQIQSLQKILADYPKEDFDGEPARKRAFDLIERLIEEQGRQVYAAYDREAKAEFELAVVEGGVARLERILARYPNAAISGEVALEIARTHLMENRPHSAYKYLSDFLNTHSEDAAFPHALYLMARAAVMEGNVSLADSLKRRLLEEYAEEPLLDDPKRTFAAVVREMGGVGQQIDRIPRIPTGDFEVRKTRFSSSRCRLIKPLGDPPDFMGSKVLILFESTGSIGLYDYEDMSMVWTQDIGRFRSTLRGGELVLLLHMKDNLVAVFESKVAALDLKSGQFLWEFDPGGMVFGAEYITGLLSLISVPLRGDVYQEKMAVITLNPASGGVLWQRTVGYTPRARFFPSQDTLCIYALTPDERFAMLLYDPLTGLQKGQVPFGHEILQPLPFPSPEGILLVLSNRPGSGSSRGGGRERFLDAYSTEQGDPLWSLSLEKWYLTGNNFMRAGDSLVIMGKARQELSGRKSILFVDLEKGAVETQASLENDSLLIDADHRLIGELLYTRSGRSRRTLTLSGFDTGTMTYQYKEQRFIIGDASTLEVRVRDVSYTENGVVIPLDFSLNRGRERVLWSQVLFVSGEDGRLLHALDLYWEGGDRIPFSATGHYPVEVVVHENAVLALKRSDLYVIQGKPLGG